MRTRVILLRHGRTLLNAEGRLRGLADPDLDDAGLAQARAAGRALADRGVSRVLSSPLRRARQTAAEVAAASGAVAEVDERFTDRDYGPWTGAVKADVVREWGSVDDAPGVEPVAEVLARAWAGLSALADAETTVVVSHDAVIRPLLEAVSPGIRPVVDTCSWAELGHDTAWRLLSHDNTA